MHVSKTRETVNTLLKQHKHNALPDIEKFEKSEYTKDSCGFGVPSNLNFVNGLFVILTNEKNTKESFFWDENGNIINLGPVETSVYDNAVVYAVMSNEGIWLFDLLIWDNKDFRDKDENLRFQCVVNLATTTQCDHIIHIPVTINPVDPVSKPSVYEHCKQFTILSRRRR